MRRVTGGLILLLAAAATPAHAAGTDNDVDAIIRQGIELRRRGKEQEALETFQRAARVRRTPHAVAQVALAEQASGLWVSAERDLKEALEGAARDAWIGKNRRQLEDAFRVIQSHLGSLEVMGQPAGAEILADGEVVGTMPTAQPLRFPVGEISLTIRKDGYDKITRGVEIKRGGLVRETVTLHRTTAAPVAAANATRKPPKLTLTEPSGGTTSEGRPAHATLKAIAVPEEPVAESHPFYSRWWFWTAVGVVAVGAGAGTYLLTRSHCDHCNDLP